MYIVGSSLCYRALHWCPYFGGGYCRRFGVTGTKSTFHISVVGAGIIKMGKINCLRLDKRTVHTCNRELSVLERCPAGDVPLYINSIFRT